MACSPKQSEHYWKAPYEIEDESGITNAIVDPDLDEANRSLVTYGKILLIEGTLQNVDRVIHIRSKHIEGLHITKAPMVFHDFHGSSCLSEPMTSPGDKQPPKKWRLEDSCRIAAFRLRRNKYISANIVPLSEQVRDCIEFSHRLGRDREEPTGGELRI